VCDLNPYVDDVVVLSGYLAVSLFLSEGHELLLLLVNTVLKVSLCLITL